MADSLRNIDRAVYVAQQAAKDDITNPVFTKFRRVSGAPIKAVTYTQSAVVDPTGQAPDQVFEDFTLDGALESEFSDGSKEFLKRAINGVESLTDVTGTDIASTATGFDSGASNAFANLVVGDFFYVGGFVDTGLNIWHHISDKADDNNITTSVAPSSIEAAGPSVNIYSRKVTSGLTKYYDILQDRLRDTSQVDDTAYKSFYNSQIDTTTVAIEPTGIINLSLGYKSSKMADQLTALTGQTDGPDDLSNSYSSALNVGGFFANGISETCQFKSMSIEITNNYSEDPAAGCDEKALGKGLISAQATISARALDDAPFKWITPAENSTDTSFAVHLKSDDETKRLIIALDRCKITDSTLTEGDVFISSDFTAIGQKSVNQSTTISLYTNY